MVSTLSPIHMSAEFLNLDGEVVETKACDLVAQGKPLPVLGETVFLKCQWKGIGTGFPMGGRFRVSCKAGNREVFKYEGEVPVPDHWTCEVGRMVNKGRIKVWGRFLSWESFWKRLFLIAPSSLTSGFATR